MKRKIKISLTKAQADALLDAGNRGVADLEDSDEDENSKVANIANEALNIIGRAFSTAWPSG